MRDVVWNQLVKPTVEIISGAVRKSVNRWLTSLKVCKQADWVPALHMSRGETLNTCPSSEIARLWLLFEPSFQNSG
jgi:hypothetical protein